MRTELDPEALVQWAALALEGMRTHRRAIDALNVFPVPDGDTGTNMFLTLEAGVEAMSAIEGASTDPGRAHLAALARGMLLGARGNSGVIMSELVRGLSGTFPENAEGRLEGRWLATGLSRAADAAHGAVSEPKEGTVLTVARAAADAALIAADHTDGDLGAVAHAAAGAARTALTATTEQLEALRRAGVVDAGGRGYVVLSDALLEAISGQRTELPEFERKEPQPDGNGDHPADVHGYGGPAYEVMFLLDALDDAMGPLKTRLSHLGDSLVVVGGDGLWNVHVHVDDAGAAVEAAIAAGHPHRIRITYLSDVIDPQASTGRGLVVVAHGPGVVDLLEASGVTAVRAPQLGRPSTAEMLAGIEATGAHEVILLTSDKDSLPVAEAAGVAARDSGRRVSVIPTRSIVQSLAAVAVHNVQEDFDDDVIAMTRAAWATQYAGLTTAVRDAMTTAGMCRVGDELGVIGGDILEIGSDVVEVGKGVLRRMMARGGAELITIILGADAPEHLADALEAWVTREDPGVEVVAYEGGQLRWHAIIGVE